MSKTINRIIELINHLNLSARQFDLSIGAANGYTLRMEKNNASVGSDVIERIVKQYPKVNLVWLITGKGHMFVDQNESSNLINSDSIDQIINEKLSEKWDEEKKKLLDEIIIEINEAKNKMQ